RPVRPQGRVRAALGAPPPRLPGRRRPAAHRGGGGGRAHHRARAVADPAPHRRRPRPPTPHPPPDRGLSPRPRGRGGLARFFEGLARGVVFGLALMAVAVVGMGDELTGYELHFTPFYFLPIWFASWFLGAAAGLALALASAIAWWAADVATRAYA